MVHTCRAGKATVSWLVSRLVARPVVTHARRNNTRSAPAQCSFYFHSRGRLLRRQGDQFTFRQLCMFCLVYVGTCNTSWVANLTEIKSCMFNEISHMGVIVTSVSMWNNFIPTFTKPATFTFASNIVIHIQETPICESIRNSHDWRKAYCVLFLFITNVARSTIKYMFFLLLFWQQHCSTSGIPT
jgi:hypothetical protein